MHGLADLAGLEGLVVGKFPGIHHRAGRHRRIARAADTSKLLQDASRTEWVENHEFWELGEVEEVAF